MNNIKPSHIYFNQLNGIRFVAVLLVLIDHWFAETLPLPIGHLGVVIFFVLSGFLITRILFINADEIRNGKSTLWQKVKNFVVRRSLRIFPIYFLICFIGLVFNISPIRDNWIWMFSYAPNWYIIYKQQWIGVWDHFWSLATEEQYYLFFPYFILLLPKKFYPILLFSMLLIGFLVRLYFFVDHNPLDREQLWFTNYVNPFTAIDCFGFGGILAYLFHYKGVQFIKYARIFLWTSLMLVPIVLLYNHSFSAKHASFTFLVLERFCFAIFSYFLIAHSICDRNDLWGTFLKLPIVDYLGKISYGLYLYHNFIYNFFHNHGNTLFGYFENKFHLTKYYVFQNQFLLFFYNFVLLVFFASISWFLIEKPFNALKNKFE